MNPKPIVVIGAGLAGLTCARTLHAAGRRVLVLDREDAVGGRIRTYQQDGFLLDKGFQVYLTAYPEARRQLDHRRLQLQSFEPGSLIWTGQKFEKLADPWRRPGQVFQTAFANVGSMADKLRIARLRWRCLSGKVEEIWQRPERPTIDELRAIGFSDRMINGFFRPFLGGVFLDADLQTSSRMLQFVFRMFSVGDAALPAAGMQAIPEQLAAALPASQIRLQAGVRSIQAQQVELDNGEVIPAAEVVVATERPAAAQLLKQLAEEERPRSVRCLYFVAQQSPLDKPILTLNGSGGGIVNNLCVPSDVAPGYSSDDRSLVSVTVLQSELTDAELADTVAAELHGWFGSQVNSWTHLRSYQIAYALPDQTVQADSDSRQDPAEIDNVRICGDHCTNGSINGAMQSGRIAAEQILQSR